MSRAGGLGKAPVRAADVAAASQPDQRFATEHLKGDLRGRAVRGGLVTMVGQGVKFILEAGSTIVLARLLTPAEFGLVAMVTAITGFVSRFKDAGLSTATVQRDQLSQAQVSTLFWINVALAAVLMVVVAASAPLVAGFYGDSRLTLITVALAGVLLVGGLTVQHQALLRREMRYSALAVVDIVSRGLAILAAIALALAGAGYWSLVALIAVTATVNAAACWIVSGWRPGPPRRRSGVRPMLAFGGNLTGFSFVNYFARNADNILIGWAIGAGPLGLYSKAYALLTLPIRQINAPLAGVAIPALSRLQNEPDDFSRFYVRAVVTLQYAALAVVAISIVCAEPVILVMLGPQWIEAADVFRLLAVGAALQPLLNTTGWIYTSLDQTGRMFRVGLGTSALYVSSFFAGLPWGIEGVAAAWASATVLSSPLQLHLAYCRSPVRLSRVLLASLRPMSVALGVGLGAWAALLARPGLSPLPSLGFACMTGALSGAALASAVPSIRRELVSLLLRVRSSRSPLAPA